jgi:hypothetical protein
VLAATTFRNQFLFSATKLIHILKIMTSTATLYKIIIMKNCVFELMTNMHKLNFKQVKSSRLIMSS